jgi:hypothetical protein
MQTTEQTPTVLKDKELQKRIEKMDYYNVDSFKSDAKRYIKAIQDNRMVCLIKSVSSSGMSRTIKFCAPEKNKYNKGRFQYCNFYQFFKAMGYNESRSKDSCFTIGGCGMDMIFHTNYTIIHRLHRIGMLTKKQCDYLAQQTPTTL